MSSSKCGALDKKSRDQERVKEELHQLNEKISRVYLFLLSEEFMEWDAEDQDLLNTQHGIMQQYSKVLTTRVNRFK